MRSSHPRRAATLYKRSESSARKQSRSASGTRKLKARGTRDTAAYAKVLLSPAGTPVKTRPDICQEQLHDDRELAATIYKRIRSRLGDRIRDLVVRQADNCIVLEGRCATYYTKQLAQHAAFGVIEDEELENLILVAVPE